MENRVCIRLYADTEQINACKKKLDIKALTINKLAGIYGLAGNEVRLKILYLLYEENELCVCDLSDILGMAISAISQHLQKLKKASLVDVRKEGQTYYYFIKTDYLLILESIFNLVNSKRELLNTELV